MEKGSDQPVPASNENPNMDVWRMTLIELILELKRSRERLETVDRCILWKAEFFKIQGDRVMTAEEAADWDDFILRQMGRR